METSWPHSAEVAQRAGVTAGYRIQRAAQSRQGRRATRQRVLKAVEALGYRPNLTARALAEGRAPTLALMVSSIANPFYPEFALAAERAARKSGHFLIVCNTNEDPEIGRAYLDQIAGTLSEGVLVMNANRDSTIFRRPRARHADRAVHVGTAGSSRRECLASRSIFLPRANWPRSICWTSATRGSARLSAAQRRRHAGRAIRRFRDAMRAGRHRRRGRVLHATDTIQGGYEAACELLTNTTGPHRDLRDQRPARARRDARRRRSRHARCRRTCR